MNDADDLRDEPQTVVEKGKQWLELLYKEIEAVSLFFSRALCVVTHKLIFFRSLIHRPGNGLCGKTDLLCSPALFMPHSDFRSSSSGKSYLVCSNNYNTPTATTLTTATT